ncbi:cytochrome P450 oxidoreductase [Clathrospora elynae]|uniref:Cytochrome P450 oxidoreductase n=1 Tax=Clathrospora elynae TaxID=706981 RepID=A0A6A5SI69_9PLEO|nr:cytochrome P450 oxidoreductase [Clathrospora elynae]
MTQISQTSIFSRQIFCIILLCFFVHRCVRYLTSELPAFGSGLKRLPGPCSTLPYIGRVHDVDRMHAWNAMKKFSDEYNGLFSCTLGGETHIWIAREDVAQDLLCNNAAISSSRADLGAYPGKDHLIRQRKFAHAIMTRNVTNKFDGHLGLETKRLMHELISNPGNYHDLIHLFCARVSSRFAYGSEGSAPEHVVNANQFLGQLGPSGPVTNLVPFLRFLPEWLVHDKRAVRLRQEAEEKLWQGMFDRTKEEYKRSGQLKTYVSASLEMRESGEEGKLLFENEKEAMFAVGMLCTVGIFTIAAPATLFIMAMVLHPEWQKKVRDQIDEVAGDELLDLKHSPRLPILRAAIKECVRWKSTVPLGKWSIFTEDYSYDGYHFPKGAVVHILDIAMSQDPQRYEDPSIYNPDRWLNETSPNYKSPLTNYPRLKGHHVFGRGKRACPGQDLAEAELIVLCGNLLKFFILDPTSDQKGDPIWPDPNKWATDVIGGPLPFECEIRPRDAAMLDMVEKMYRDGFT